MEGFNVADAFCRNTYACGGVVIFLSILLTFKVINLKWLCEEKNFEAVAIIVKQLNIIVACVYRSPSGNVGIFINKLEKLLLHLSKYGLVMLIGGDFNSDFDVNVPQPNVTRFLNLLNQFNCHCTNFNPTRNNACLDNIVINQDFKDFKVFVVEESLSDHSGVLMCMNNSQKNACNRMEFSIMSRALGASNMEHFKNHLSSVNRSFLWLNISDSAEYCFDAFFDKFMEIFNFYCPPKSRLIKTTRRHKVNWYDNSLEKMKSRLMLLHKNYQITRDNNDHLKYKEFKNKYKCAVNEAKMVANQ